MSVLTPEAKKYAIIGGVTLAVLLLVVAVTLYFAGKDPTVVGGIGTALAAAAAEAERRRRAEIAKLRATQRALNTLGDEIGKNRTDAKTDMNAIPTTVENMTDKAKIDEGNDLFG